MWETENFYRIPRILTVDSINTAFESHKKKDYCFYGEMHNFWEIVFVKSGTASVTKDDKIYRLAEGEVTLHKPMEFHRLMSVGEAFKVIVISFSSDSEALYSISDGNFYVGEKGKAALSGIVDEIKKRFETEDIIIKGSGENSAAEQITVCRLELFLLELLKTKNRTKTLMKTRTARSFAAIIDFMNGNLSNTLSVKEIADGCNMSESNLKKIIKKYTGAGVNKHFMRLKMVRATAMLEEGMNVNEVSEALGFSSPAYFSYVFKRETGVPPIKHRT